MSFKIINKMPVIVLRSKDEYGHAKGPIIWLPEKDPNGVFAIHELYHVRQFYFHFLTGMGMAALVFVTGVSLIAGLAIEPHLVVLMCLWAFAADCLFWARGKNRWRRECAAYANHIRAANYTWSNRRLVAQAYANLLAEEPYTFPYTPEESFKRIMHLIDHPKLMG